MSVSSTHSSRSDERRDVRDVHMPDAKAMRESATAAKAMREKATAAKAMREKATAAKAIRDLQKA